MKYVITGGEEFAGYGFAHDETAHRAFARDVPPSCLGCDYEYLPDVGRWTRTSWDRACPWHRNGIRPSG